MIAIHEVDFRCDIKLRDQDFILCLHGLALLLLDDVPDLSDFTLA